MSEQESQSSVRQALVIFGGWEGHEPEKTAEIVAARLRDQNFSVELTPCCNQDVSQVARLELESYDLIVPVWSWGSKQPEAMERVFQAVEAGTGLATFHGGIDWFADREYSYLIGGSFLFHPPGMRRYRVHIEPGKHPITAGLVDFEVETEQYYFHVDPGNTVLTTTRFDNIIMPNTWTKTYGKGRVFYCSLGHTPDQVQQVEAMELLCRGMAWAARRPADQ